VTTEDKGHKKCTFFPPNGKTTDQTSISTLKQTPSQGLPDDMTAAMKRARGNTRRKQTKPSNRTEHKETIPGKKPEKPSVYKMA